MSHAHDLRITELLDKYHSTGEPFTVAELNEIANCARNLYMPVPRDMMIALCEQSKPKPDVETYRKVVEEYIKHIAETGLEPDPEAAMIYLDSQAEYEAIKKAAGL